MYAQKEKPKKDQRRTNISSRIQTKSKGKINNTPANTKKLPTNYSTIQCLADRVKFGNSIGFTVHRADMAGGSDTNPQVRADVNSLNPTNSGDNITVGWATYQNNNQVGGSQISNIDNTMNPQKWDAGHLLAQINGGVGTDVNWVFRQDPALNRGLDGLYQNWKGEEANFNTALKNLPNETRVNAVANGNYGVWNVTL
jgi:hypothetical protein